jgi:hypothetical protein
VLRVEVLPIIVEQAREIAEPRCVTASTARQPERVERDSVPLHVLAKESEETRLAVARLVVENAELWRIYSSCLGTFLPDVWKEIVRMARTKKEQPAIDIRPLIELLGPDEFIKVVGLKDALEQLGINRTVGVIGVERVVDEIGVDTFLAQLSPEQRAEFKRLLEQSEGPHTQ